MSADPTPAAGGLSDAERAAIQDSSGAPGRLSRGHFEAVERIIAARTEAADREAARVTAAVEALADAWEATASGYVDPSDGPIWFARALSRCARQLRAALASAGTDALDRERAKAATEVAERIAQEIEAQRGRHWQRHLRDHPHSDAISCPADYGKHDAYAAAVNIARAAAESPEGGGA